MELASLVTNGQARGGMFVLARAELAEVFRSSGDEGREEMDEDSAEGLTAEGYVEEDSV